MRQEGEKYIIRFPTGMRDQIREMAKENRRSMNAEILHCLSQVLENKATGQQAE